jgi:hypothetical protein
MSNLLINEPPLQVLPTLAVVINKAINDSIGAGHRSGGGLNEAIVLQQIHYWLNSIKTTGRIVDGEKWIYNSISSWAENFPFWSENTIRRALQNLETLGLIKSRNDLNKIKIDQTKWYTINYEALKGLPFVNIHKPVTQNGQASYPEWVDQPTILGKPIPETTAEITQPIGGDSIEDFIPGLKQQKQSEYQPVKPGSPEAMMLALGITAKDNNPLAAQIEDLHNYGWHIKQANVETAIAAFLTATQLHIPTVTAERKKWIAGAEAHIQEFGVEGLAARYKAAWDEVFPKILDGQLDITHPAALTFKLRAQLQRNHLTENKKPVAKRYIDPQDPRNWKALGYTE